MQLNTRSPDADREHSTYLHATLERIDQLANDVEMRVRASAECSHQRATDTHAPLTQDPPLEEQTYLILDTNILLHHFEVIQQFITDIEALNLPVRTVIPGAVINELDGYVVNGPGSGFLVFADWGESADRKIAMVCRGLRVAHRRGC